MDTLLSLKNIGLSFGEKLVLRDINAIIPDLPNQGQIVALLGPSGIGKTQLFRMIGGLNPPTVGEILITGEQRKVITGEVGVVAQSYPLFQHRTVMSNLKLAADLSSNPKERLDKIKFYLDKFQITHIADKFPLEISGGQKQRTAIVQQLLCSDHFLLMDEPFSGLDVLMVDEVCNIIRIVADLDELNTLILITHDIKAAIAVSDELWMIGREPDKPGATLKYVVGKSSAQFTEHNVKELFKLL